MNKHSIEKNIRCQKYIKIVNQIYNMENATQNHNEIPYWQKYTA